MSRPLSLILLTPDGGGGSDDDNTVTLESTEGCSRNMNLVYNLAHGHKWRLTVEISSHAVNVTYY
jgi:hypothetical protein